MDKKERKLTEACIETACYMFGIMLYFVLGLKIANSNMKALWKVLGIDLVIRAGDRCTSACEKARNKIHEIHDGNSIEYVKKVK